MTTAIVTGAGGLIGSASVRRFAADGWDVVGIDNDTRSTLFGAEASTRPMIERLQREVPGYTHLDVDIRDAEAMERLFSERANDVGLVIHAAAQPSHDWAAREPMVDFSINATGTLVLLEQTRRSAPEATFLFTSTNKVYGDLPNHLPLEEHDTRWELPTDHQWFGGIPETMSIDQSTHSVFGVSKASADLLVQEYGRYFGLATAVFRGGCLTGPGHAGAELHGFLAYLMKCVVDGRPYRVFGYKGKQVRDNIHSSDLVSAFAAVAARPPKPGSVYNMGGGRQVNCSMLEAIELSERIAGRRLDWDYVDDARIGDHQWWVSDVRRFRVDYPEWEISRDLEMILQEIHDDQKVLRSGR